VAFPTNTVVDTYDSDDANLASVFSSDSSVANNFLATCQQHNIVKYKISNRSESLTHPCAADFSDFHEIHCFYQHTDELPITDNKYGDQKMVNQFYTCASQCLR